MEKLQNGKKKLQKEKEKVQKERKKLEEHQQELKKGLNDAKEHVTRLRGMGINSLPPEEPQQLKSAQEEGIQRVQQELERREAPFQLRRRPPQPPVRAAPLARHDGVELLPHIKPRVERRPRDDLAARADVAERVFTRAPRRRRPLPARRGQRQRLPGGGNETPSGARREAGLPAPSDPPGL